MRGERDIRGEEGEAQGTRAGGVQGALDKMT